MPFTAYFVDDGKGVHKIGTGIVTGADIFANSLIAANDEIRSRQLRYGLIDFSSVTDMQVTPLDVRRIVEVNRKAASYNSDALVAIIAPSALPYAISRLWHTLSDDLGWTSHVFRTRPDALGWLKGQLLTRYDSETAREQFPSLEWSTSSEPSV